MLQKQWPVLIKIYLSKWCDTQTEIKLEMESCRSCSADPNKLEEFLIGTELFTKKATKKRA